MSTHSASTATTNASDLTEIVEVDGDGKVIKKVDVRPAGAPKNGSNVRQLKGANLDDVFGDGGWTDTDSSDSDLDPTDDEWEYPKTVSSTLHSVLQCICSFELCKFKTST